MWNLIYLNLLPELKNKRIWREKYIHTHTPTHIHIYTYICAYTHIHIWLLCYCFMKFWIFPIPCFISSTSQKFCWVGCMSKFCVSCMTFCRVNVPHCSTLYSFPPRWAFALSSLLKKQCRGECSRTHTHCAEDFPSPTKLYSSLQPEFHFPCVQSALTHTHAHTCAHAHAYTPIIHTKCFCCGHISDISDFSVSASWVSAR